MANRGVGGRRIMNPKSPHPPPQIQDLESKIQTPKIQDPESKIKTRKSKPQNPRSRIQN